MNDLPPRRNLFDYAESEEPVLPSSTYEENGKTVKVYPARYAEGYVFAKTISVKNLTSR